MLPHRCVIVSMSSRVRAGAQAKVDPLTAGAGSLRARVLEAVTVEALSLAGLLRSNGRLRGQVIIQN